MEYSKLIDIRNKIEGLSQIHHIEILRILYNANNKLNENKYGIHINLMNVEPATIDLIQSYLEYAIEQELTLSRTESQKAVFKKEFKNISITKTNSHGSEHI